MRYLLEFPPTQKGSRKLFLDARDQAGNTPLMISARQGHARMLALLVSYGVLVNTKNDAKQTIIHQAVHAHSVETLGAALRLGADINASDTQEWTPLHCAAVYNDLEACKRLMRQGASPAIKDTHGHTVLHVAAKAGHVEVVALLIDNGADVNAQDSACRTPLHAAVTSKRDGAFDCIKTLLASGHVKPELRDGMWKTTGELAHGRDDVLALFQHT